MTRNEMTCQSSQLYRISLPGLQRALNPDIVTNGLKGRGSAFLYRFPVDFIIILTFCVRLRVPSLNYNKLLVAFRHCSPAATTHDHTSSSPVLKRSPCHLQPLLCSASYFTNTKINDGHLLMGQHEQDFLAFFCASDDHDPVS